MTPLEEILAFLVVITVITLPTIAIIVSKSKKTIPEIDELQKRLLQVEKDNIDKATEINELKGSLKFLENILEDKSRS